jgi:hypothetical protein
MEMRIRVECHAGYRGEEEPVALYLGERRLEVTEVMDRWLAPTHRYFKVRVGDGRQFVLRHDETIAAWELAALVGSAAGAHRIGHTLH